LPRNTIQVSYSTYSDRLARDVQQLLLEFGVVSRLYRYEKGEVKVVITNRRDILDSLASQGFVRGLTPTRPHLGDMHEAVPRLLKAFSAQVAQ